MEKIILLPIANGALRRATLIKDNGTASLAWVAESNGKWFTVAVESIRATNYKTGTQFHEYTDNNLTSKEQEQLEEARKNNVIEFNIKRYSGEVELVIETATLKVVKVIDNRKATDYKLLTQVELIG